MFGDRDVEFGVLREIFDDGVRFGVNVLLELVVVLGGVDGEDWEEEVELHGDDDEC